MGAEKLVRGAMERLTVAELLVLRDRFVDAPELRRDVDDQIKRRCMWPDVQRRPDIEIEDLDGIHCARSQSLRFDCGVAAGAGEACG